MIAARESLIAIRVDKSQENTGHEKQCRKCGSVMYQCKTAYWARLPDSVFLERIR